MKRESSIIILEDFKKTLKKTGRITRQKISKEIEGFNAISQFDLINIYRTFYLTAEYTFFSKLHGICPCLDHVQAIKQISVN